MECKECGTELIILERGPLLFENDDRADAKTRAYYNYKYSCRNPNCGAYGQVAEEKKVYIND